MRVKVMFDATVSYGVAGNRSTSAKVTISRLAGLALRVAVHVREPVAGLCHRVVTEDAAAIQTLSDVPADDARHLHVGRGKGHDTCDGDVGGAGVSLVVTPAGSG